MLSGGKPAVKDETKGLVDGASAGDPVAMEMLLEKQLPALRAFVRLRAGQHVRAHESSSDLVQSVCREVLQDLPRFHYTSEAAFRGWLYESALHKIYDRQRYWRAQKRDASRECELAADATTAHAPGLLERYASFCTPSRSAMAHEEIERIESAFETLPDDYRRVIALTRIAGLSHADAAREMNRSEDSVRNLLSRALARLSGELVKGGTRPGMS